MPDCRSSYCIQPINHGAPEWLTKEFIVEKLRIYYSDPSLEVASVSLSEVSPPGENFGGIMTRVSVEFRTEGDQKSRTGSYVVKSTFEGNEYANKIMKPYNTFKTEMGIYDKIIPKINTLLEEIGDTNRMFPETIAVAHDHSGIMFEDLSHREFVNCDRTQGLDMEHAKLCLNRLARMHAASAVLNEREPGIFKSYDRGFFNRYTESFSPMFLGLLEACGRMVSQWEDFKQYGEKILALKPKLMEYGKQVFDAVDGQVNVLAHGDFWTNNVMFKEDSNQIPSDVIIIDFQYTCWGSPAIDLHYFFNTSLREEMRLHQQDELLQFYYKIFAKTLRDLRFRAKIPSLHMFRLQMAEKAFYAFTSGCLVQAVMLNKETENADFNSLMGVDERALNFRNIVYKNEKLQKNLKRLLPIFDRMGLLDHRD